MRSINWFLMILQNFQPIWTLACDLCYEKQVTKSRFIADMARCHNNTGPLKNVNKWRHISIACIIWQIWLQSMWKKWLFMPKKAYLTPAWMHRAGPSPRRRGLKCRYSLRPSLKYHPEQTSSKRWEADLPGGRAEYCPRKSSRRMMGRPRRMRRRMYARRKGKQPWPSSPLESPLCWG